MADPGLILPSTISFSSDLHPISPLQFLFLQQMYFLRISPTRCWFCLPHECSPFVFSVSCYFLFLFKVHHLLNVTFIKLHALLSRGKCTTKSLLILHQCERMPWQHVHPMSICYLSHTILMPLSMPRCMCMHVHTQQCAGVPHIWWINAPTCTQVFVRCAWGCQRLLKSV